MSAVYLITGIQAAGKSTVAQALAERLPRAAHVRGDVFRRMVVGGAEPITPHSGEEAVRRLRLRYRIAAAVADMYAAEGFTAVVQDVVLGPELAYFVESVRTRPLMVVVLAPDAETVARRERGRAKKAYGTWTVEALDEALRRDTPRLGLWLDTSRQTPAETVEEILARSAEARV